MLVRCKDRMSSYLLFQIGYCIDIIYLIEMERTLVTCLASHMQGMQLCLDACAKLAKIMRSCLKEVASDSQE